MTLGGNVPSDENAGQILPLGGKSCRADAAEIADYRPEAW
jgi:hypothetical protein